MQRQIKVDKEDLYMLKINWKVKRLVRKENKGINVEKIIISLQNEKKRKEKRIKREAPQNCKNRMQKQRFITTIKNVTEGKKAQKLNQISQYQ